MGGLAEHYKCSMTTIKKLFKLHNIEARFAKTSVGQLQVANYIESLGFKAVLNDRKLINPLELDIVIPEKNVIITRLGERNNEKDNNRPKDFDIYFKEALKMLETKV